MIDYVYIALVVFAFFVLYTWRRPGKVDPQLYRSRDDRMVGGVLGGLGPWRGIAPLWLRLAWIALFLLLAPFRLHLIIAYALAWAMIPRARAPYVPIPPLEERLRGTGVEAWQIRTGRTGPSLYDP